MKASYRRISIHILGCLVFLSIPIFSSPDFGDLKNMMQIPPFERSFLTFFFLLLFFYLNYYFLIERVYFKKQYFGYFLAVFMCYILVTYLPYAFVPEENFDKMPRFITSSNYRMPPPHNDMSFYLIHARSLLQFLAVFFLTLLLRINAQWRNAKQDKLKAEVSYMKAQINPHFLFNTLNSLYALTIEKSDAAPDAVLKLSNMMRYVVTESTSDFVSLEKEINYIQDYIAMQRLRIDDQNHLKVTVEGNPKGKVITPLVVIPFIENAFKYGINNEEDWQITIAIKITETDFVLEVTNNIVDISFPEYAATEKGIENTQKRLDFNYPAKHELVIHDTPERYQVYLKIDLS